MAVVDDQVKEVIDSNKAKRYRDNTIEMFKKWLKNCPVEYADVTSNELEAHSRTICFSIIKRK